MSRRIEIELTSDRGDGTWTWRAAGAQKPRGVVPAGLVPAGAKAGAVLRAEIEVEIEGITVVSVASGPERERKEPERIEVVGSRRSEDELVTTQLSGRARTDRDRRDKRDRPPRGDGERRDRGEHNDRGDRRDRPPRTDRPAADHAGGDSTGRRPRSARPEGDRRPRRPAPPPLPERPKPKRLRPGRVHRKAVLADIAPEQQPIAEQVLKGGIPAVRQAIEAENDKRKAADQPPINAPELLEMAERLLPRLRTADWRDRADAALADADELDLRDLRSVVVASDAAARDDETRALAADLRAKLEARVEAEHQVWLEDLGLALSTGRVVRALRLSSRPPKAGTILPPELRTALTEAAAASLTPDATPDRWGAVLDAAAYAPVRTDVAPATVPESPSDELVATVKKYASRVPKVAAAFGIEAPTSGRALRPARPPRRSGVVPVPKRIPPPHAIGAPATEPTVTSGAPSDATPIPREPDAADAPEDSVAGPVRPDPDRPVEEPADDPTAPPPPDPDRPVQAPAEAPDAPPVPDPDRPVEVPAEDTAADSATDEVAAAPSVDAVSDDDAV
jgi:hypothetical protein